MAKDPAFLFYPGDWLGGTITFTRAQKGAYLDLLIAQFGQVSLTIGDIKQILGADFEAMWESKLKNKFEMESNGTLFFNRKLRDEAVRRMLYSESRRKNKTGHMTTHMTNHMTGHMETETETRVIKRTTNTTKRKKFTPPSLDEVRAYCKERKSHIDPETFFHTYEGSGWIKANGLPVLNWKSTVVTWEKKNPSANKGQLNAPRPDCKDCSGSGVIFSQGTSKNVPCWCRKQKGD